MSELKILFPEPEVIDVHGYRVEIRPVVMSDFDLFGKTASGLFGYLADGSLTQLNAYAVTHSADLSRVVARCTSLSRWRVRRLPSAVVVQVLVQIIRVNAGFFVAAQAAMVEALAGLR